MNVIKRNQCVLDRLQVPSFDPKKFSLQNQQHMDLARNQVRAGSFVFYNLRIDCPEKVFHPTPDSSSCFFIRHSLPEIGSFARNVVEIGTGTGAIIIYLKKTINVAEAIGVDMSEKAVNAARKNADNNGAHVKFLCLDITQQKFDELADIAIFNAPLYDFLPKLTVEQDVLCDPDGNILRGFLLYCKKNLRAEGRALFTISNLGPSFVLDDFEFDYSNIGYEAFGTTFCRALILARPLI